MEIECQKCGYEWDTGSDMMMVTCPSCARKTPREENLTFNSRPDKPSLDTQFFTPTKLMALIFIGILVLATGFIVTNGPVAEERAGDDDGAMMASMQIVPQVNVLKNGEEMGSEELSEENVDN